MKNFLPQLLADITGHPRYKPDIIWSSKSWVHNVFRCYEMVFGRKYGIRAEISSWHENGKSYYSAHSFEAVCALFETWVRNRFPYPVLKWVKLPSFQTPQGIALPSYSFAIAYGAPSGEVDQSTQSHTVTGTDNLLYVSQIGDFIDTTTAMTYAAVAMTETNQIQFTADRFVYGFILAGPATGANNIVQTGATFSRLGGLSYTGCKQTGQPDSAANVGPTTADPAVLTTTVVAADCWLVGFEYGGTLAGPGSGTTFRNTQLGFSIMGDSAATVGTGSQSLNWDLSAADLYVGVIVSIAPVASASFLPRRMRMGIGM